MSRTYSKPTFYLATNSVRAQHQRAVGALCPDVERVLSLTKVQGGLPGPAASSPALQAVLPLAVSLEARVAEHGALNPLEVGGLASLSCLFKPVRCVALLVLRL